MTEFTHEEQLANLELALRLWNERVRPRKVSADLAYWKCGTQACFGGHLGTWPEFQAKGVSRWSNGAPRMDDLNSVNISQHLFGSDYLFMSRRVGDTGTAHAVIAKRLALAIEMKREQIATLATAQA